MTLNRATDLLSEFLEQGFVPSLIRVLTAAKRCAQILSNGTSSPTKILKRFGYVIMWNRALSIPSLASAAHRVHLQLDTCFVRTRASP